ncbi:hypothetical protein [Ferrimonas marina]|uniref:Outer membrane protein assembly factor BamE, lipoprotein component of the BamABCDE complex n=1 Tax=Ferrimonas marina TaxID=299255 RepID=A0A1M5RWX3_9GAMM|nr:hypothetical protein [Ferrimonas marina]SHH30303.1 hypothetical protein SAMN02745129_1770 [Ferrimonas marina]
MKIGMIALLLSLLAGCAQFNNNRGVEVGWQENLADTLVKGESHRRDVLALLGPPSQMVALGDESALYYLFEKERGNALILVVYNRLDRNTRYDRAVFFFDENDLLTDYATVVQDES